MVCGSEPDRCLCGLLDVKTGTKIIAILFLVGAVLDAIALVFRLLAGSLMAVLLVAKTLVFSVPASCAIHGVHTMKHRWVLPMLILMSIELGVLVGAVVAVIGFAVVASLQHRSVIDGVAGLVIYALYMSVAIAFNVWFCNTVLNCYRHIRSLNMGRTHENCAGNIPPRMYYHSNPQRSTQQPGIWSVAPRNQAHSYYGA